jgi:predicted nucleic-acid-binding protein
MIGLDTNLLLRLLVEDDPAQTERAKRFVESRCTPQSPGFINHIVLAEFVWVLASSYDYPRAEVADAVEGLLTGQDRVVDAEEDVRAALADYRSGKTHLIDSLIGRVNLARGCEATATFDRGAAKLEGFVRVA